MTDRKVTCGVHVCHLQRPCQLQSHADVPQQHHTSLCTKAYNLQPGLLLMQSLIVGSCSSQLCPAFCSVYGAGASYSVVSQLNMDRLDAL